MKLLFKVTEMRLTASEGIYRVEAICREPIFATFGWEVKDAREVRLGQTVAVTVEMGV